MTKPELLAPAGDFEKLQIAINYGADAVYISGPSFGLRAKAKNFGYGTDPAGQNTEPNTEPNAEPNTEMKQAVSYAHQHGVKVYVTANIYAHNSDIDKMAGYFKTLADIGVDAFIISDPGVFSLAKKEAPDVEIHISTQANTTNYASAQFWRDMGASRIILARELNLEEIALIYGKLAGEIEGLPQNDTKCDAKNEVTNEVTNGLTNGLTLEAFVHGAMCMAYSGRCMLSRYMSGRDANLGNCAHPCRYNYRLYAEEVTRPGYFMPVEENENGTDIFGAEDLCMVAHIPALIAAGIKSFKIEGRMKSAFYVGLATRTYRQAIDTVFADQKEYESRIPHYLEMLKMASHRPFTTGFYFGGFGAVGVGAVGTDHTAGFAGTDGIEVNSNNLENYVPSIASYARTHDFVGIVREYMPETRQAVIEQRNVFEAGDILTFILPEGPDQDMNFSMKIESIQLENGTVITRAPHAQQRVLVTVDEPVQPFTLVAREA